MKRLTAPPAIKEQLAAASNSELRERLLALRKQEHHLCVDILLFLNEVEARKLFAEAGYSSMFRYCCKVLRYSESGANRRIRVARLIRRFPEAEKLLRRGAVNLSTLSLAAGVISETNHRELLSCISGKSQREVEKLIAELQPGKAVQERIRPVRAAGSVQQMQMQMQQIPIQQTPVPEVPVQRSLGDPVCYRRSGGRKNKELENANYRRLSEIERISNNRTLQVESTQERGAQKRAAASVRESALSDSAPLQTEIRYQLSFSIDAAAKKKLARAQALLSSKCPDAGRLELVLDLLLEDSLNRRDPVRKRARDKSMKDKRAKSKQAKRAPAGEESEKAKKIEKSEAAEKSEKPSRAARKTKRKAVSASVKRAVLERDGYCCSYRAPDGTRCGSVWGVELDHVVPVACGGSNDAENLRVLCRVHNGLAADRWFGRKFMDSKRRGQFFDGEHTSAVT